MMLGLITPTSGEVRLLGDPMPAAVSSVLPRVGALVEGPGFAGYLSGPQNLHRLDTADPGASGRTRRARIGAALDRVGLTAAGDKAVKAYSLGMKQRLGLANALLRPRDLLVLDEPTNGLDPQGTREVRALIRGLTSDGTTVFVSSHLLAEIEQLCSHVGVMRAGRLVAQGTLDELRDLGAATVHVTTPDADTAARVLAAASSDPVERVDDGVRIPLGTIAPEALVVALVAADVRVRGFRVEEPSLEERFVELTGEGFDVDG
jgi:ABC-2 type transport system ATP-binding protein